MRRALPILAVLALAGCASGEEITALSSTTASSTLSTTTDTSSSATAPSTTGPAADAGDEEAQALARSGQSAIELYATDNSGSYAGLDAAALREIEPTLPEDIIVSGGKNFYSLTVPSPDTGNFFKVESSVGTVSFTCSEPAVALCGEDGTW